MAPSLHWSQNCEAAKFLKSALENVEIDLATQPKHVWESNPIFKQFPLQQFQGGWNKAKSDAGLNVHPEMRGAGGGGFKIGKQFCFI